MSDIAVKVDNVSKVYKLYDRPSDRVREAFGLSRKKWHKEHYALKDVSFDIKKGECVGIIGTNGSGKSTILKIITGVLSPTEGNLEIQGRISALLELGAGFNMEYTGLENVYLNGTMLGFSKQEIEEKLQNILEFADIGEFINQPVKMYSSGMFVRLAFAVAINIDPEILIVDEALSVGDVFFQVKCYKKFEEFKKMGKTILFVSHDLGSITKYCDRVVLLNKGCKVGEGEAKDMIDLYKKILADSQSDPNTWRRAGENLPEQEGNLWKHRMLINPNKQEYGDRKALIADFGIFNEKGEVTDLLNKLEQFSLKMKIMVNEDIEDPIVAFTIRDMKGTELAGTNTNLENISFGRVHANEQLEVEFKQKMVLQNGQYLLQLGCTSYGKEGLLVHHRLYDICCIQVVSNKITIGYFDIDTTVEYTRRKEDTL